MNTELTKGFVDFIDDNRLQSLIHDTKEDPAVYREILKKSLSKQPLTVEETAALIAVTSTADSAAPCALPCGTPSRMRNWYAR